MKTKIISILIILILVGFNFPENCESQWVKTNGPIGGSIRSFTAIGSTVFAGTNSGVYRSSDFGLSWSLTSPTNFGNINSLTSSGSYIYAGCSTGNGVKLSTDNGTTWSNTSLTYGIYAIAATGPYVFAATNDFGLYRSTDYGQTWARMTALPSQNFYSVAVDDALVYAGSHNSGVYRSTDYGNTWVQKVVRTEPIHALAIKGSRVFATCESSLWGINYGIYGSTDYGDTWTIRALTNRDIWSLEVNGDYIFAGDQEDPTGVYRSSDDGVTWIQTTLNYVNINPNSVFCLGSRVFAGTTSLECFVSNDYGETWEINSGVLNNSSVYSLTTSGINIFAGTNNFVYKTSDNGQHWNSCLEQYAKALVSNNSIIYAGIYSNKGVFRSLDNGQTWTQTPLNNKTVYSLAVSGNNILAGTSGYGIYYSADEGLTWAQTSLTNKTIYSIAVSGSNIFAGDYGVYLSTDNGLTWGLTTLNNRTIYSLAVSGNYIFAGTSGYGVYFSTDNGQTWTQTTLSNRTINSLTVWNNYILAGTSSYGVYLSTDYGQTWTQAGINSYSINSILIKDNDIYSGTLSNAVWRRTRTEMIPPSLISPENNSIVNIFTPILNWENISGEAFYNLKVSTDPEFSSAVVDLTQHSQSSYTIPSGILEDSTSYYWKVSGVGGVWSDVRKFTVNIPITPEYTIEKIEILKEDILSLLNSKIISQDNYDMLVSKLNNAIQQIEQQHYKISINSIEQFIFEVNLLVKKIILSPEQAQPLLTQAYRIITMLEILNNSENDFLKITSEPEKTYSLNQNYPNPFNPVTTIKFSIANESQVNLSVYDLSGRMIKNIVSARLNAGSYEYMFNGANLASGIYLYKLVTDNYTAVKKMVLVK